MKKSYIIMGILICIIAFLGYLQYGHEEQAVNTMVSTSGAFYKQEFDVIANKLFALFVAMDCSSITTSSHVRPVISPIRIEQENAKCIQMVNKSSSDC